MTEKKKRGRPRKIKPEDLKFAKPDAKDFEWAKGAIKKYEDSKGQTMNDIIETGRCITEFKPDGIRRIDPLSPEAEAILANLEHPDQFTEIKTVKYPKDWDTMSKVEKLKYLTANPR